VQKGWVIIAVLAVTTVTTGQLEPTTGWSHQHQALRIAPKLSCLCQKEVASTARQCCTATRTSHTTQPELHCSSLAVAPFHSMAVWCCNPLQPIKRCKTAAIRHSAAGTSSRTIKQHLSLRFNCLATSTDVHPHHAFQVTTQLIQQCNVVF